MAYSKKVIDRFESVLNDPHKHSVGSFDPNDPNVATGMTGAPACGDVMRLQIKLNDEERIVDVKFKTYGCGSAIASSTLFVDMLKGKTIEEAKQVKDKDIAKELELFNRQLGKENPYLLIGPGRWGTADPWLGIPVNWKQISHARVMVEIGIDELNPEPSFGSHFFQNVTSLRIGYFTLQHVQKGGDLDIDWLNKQPIKQATKFIRWIHLKENLHITINGRIGTGVILKPQQKVSEVMDEEESTGI